MDAADRNISLEDFADLPEGSYTLYDIRNESAYAFGTIPGAGNAPDLVDLAENGRIPRDKKCVIFCMNGTASEEAQEKLSRLGYDAYSISGGYAAWIRKKLTDVDRSGEIEASLRDRRRFRETLFSPFAKAVTRYELVEPDDRIAVCISGGKDSMLMAKLFQELKRHNKFHFELVFLVMDPGYNELNRLIIEKNAAMLGIPVTICETEIFDAVYHVDKSPCYLCARMRRGYLYNLARQQGCNKIALGHHFDDVIETTLMGLLWSGQFQGMRPKLRSSNFPGMELIRPMYLIREDDIKAWRDENDLHFIQCACRFTDTCSSCRQDGSPVSKRMETKLLIRKLREENPGIEKNIFRSMSNVCLDTLLGYKKDGKAHDFLEEY